MPRLKSINYYQNEPKHKDFCKKIKFFECWILCLQTHKTAPSPLQLSGDGADTKRVLPYFQVLDSYKEKLLS